MAIKISEFLKPKAIIMDIKSKGKIEAIQELVDHMVAHKFVKDGEEFLKALAKRENLESTGIGNGIAIPHARTDAVKDVLLAFARSADGVDFSSIDGKPSYLIFLIASPEKKKSYSRFCFRSVVQCHTPNSRAEPHWLALEFR